MLNASIPERIETLILIGETRLVRVALFGETNVTALQVRHPQHGVLTFAMSDDALAALQRGCEDALRKG